MSEETLGQRAQRVLAEARAVLADPTKAAYHERLQKAIDRMEHEVSFWNHVVEHEAADEDCQCCQWHERLVFNLTTPRQYTPRGGWLVNCECGAAIGETGDADLEARHAAHRAEMGE